jgi:alkyldihydroxyacetonephosphate synthase
MVACTLVFEGSANDVKHQEDLLYRIAAQHNGMQAGAENGERGYLLTYNIAYIRDFGNEHYIMAESFETSIPWSRVIELCDRVKQRVKEEHALRKLPIRHLPGHKGLRYWSSRIFLFCILLQRRRKSF